MKIVQFKDGTYGIRKGNWFRGYKFVDLNAPIIYDWPRACSNFDDWCKSSDLREIKRVLKALKEIKDNGKVIKEV